MAMNVKEIVSNKAVQLFDNTAVSTGSAYVVPAATVGFIIDIGTPATDTITIEVSNDGTNFYSLTDGIDLTADVSLVFDLPFGYVRVDKTAGTAQTNVWLTW